MQRFVLIYTLFFAMTYSRSIPSFIQTFYANVMPGNCTGNDLLQGGFYDEQNGSPDWAYCQQDVTGQAIFLKGPGTFANMDVDCDGASADDRCASSTDTQGQTTFQSLVQPYGISDLNATLHTYVVLGNQGNYSPTFDPQKYGVHPLSVVAVVCGGNLVFAVWGDTNGDDGPPLVGEASLATATLCFGDSIIGNNGHDQSDVLYIAFTGSDAVTGDSARWNATSSEEFEASLADLGNSLLTRLNGTAKMPAATNNGLNRSLFSSSGVFPIMLCIFWILTL